jgi:hypothetical protein
MHVALMGSNQSETAPSWRKKQVAQSLLIRVTPYFGETHEKNRFIPDHLDFGQ